MNNRRRNPYAATLLAFLLLGGAAANLRAQLLLDPGSFTAIDIGSPAVPGSFTPNAGGFDVAGGGTNIFGSSDQFQFGYQTLAGDFDVQVRVMSLSFADAWSKAGLMARESLTGGSRYAGSFATPSISGAFLQFRAAASGQTTNVGSFPVSYPETWLRLKRAGPAFTAFASPDGTLWATLGTATLSSPSNSMFVGLAVASASASAATTAQFRNLINVTGTPTLATPILNHEPIGPSSRRTELVISEIMYHPRAIPGQTNSGEFIEIYNAQSYPQRVGGFSIAGSVSYTFPAGTVIAPGAYVVVARDPALVRSYYGITGVLGPWVGAETNGLPGSSGLVQLRNRQGAVLLEVPYIAGSPWPVAADGSGHSLVLTRPSYGERDPRAWSISDALDGSPGRAEPFTSDLLQHVVINELFAHSNPPDDDYIELYNHDSKPVDLSGAVLTDDLATNKFRIPTGVVLAARGFVVYHEAALGFALNAKGERVFLISSNGARVIDAVEFGNQAAGRSSGRLPDGARDFYPLAERTPGAANGKRWQSPVVINELMRTPISGNADDEYIELYNRSTNTVNLGNWKFTSGVSFTFPANTLLAPDQYLVVGRNPANLLAHYPGVLSAANTLGPYSGTLGNSDSLALSYPDELVGTNAVGQEVTNIIHVLANDVAYGKGGRWGNWSEGGGSSLELVDPDSDTRLAANWADSDESAKSQNFWTTVEFKGPLGESLNTPINDNLEIFLLGIGECLVDEVEVRANNGPNLVSNNGFESGVTDWTLQGSHDQSTAEAVGFAGGRSLHLRAGSRGDNQANRIFSKGFAPAISGNPIVDLKAKVRWLRGWPEILLRLHGGTAEAVGILQVPQNLGTPGQRNSRAVPNAGPAIYDVAHAPILPAANEPVVVTAKANDPDGLGALTLRYRADAGETTVNAWLATYVSVRMLDDGTGGDAVAGDGIFSATIPAQAGGKTVAFYVQGVDALGATNLFPQDVFPAPGMKTCFPNDAPGRECVVRWGDFQMAGSFATYHLWLTFASSNRWAGRDRLNNAELDGTFVYNDSRAIYNALPLYAGSPWHSGQMTTGPCGSSRVDYVMNFPADELLLGNTDFVLNNPGNPSGTTTSDTAAQSEQASYLIFDEIGLVFNHRRYIHYFVNGSQRSTTADRAGNFIFEDSQQPNGDMVSQWFPTDTTGELYKIEDWFEFQNDGFTFSNNDADITRRTILLNGQQTLVITPYRFMFRRRSVGPGDSTADYTNFFNLVNAASPAANPNAGTVDPVALGSIADWDQWMRVFAVQHTVGNWDSYGFDRGKNDYTYKPSLGVFQQMTWDIDFTMGWPSGGGRGPSEPLFNANDPRVVAMWSTPAIVRSYYRAYYDIVNGPLNNAFMDPILDAKQAALLANNINVDTNGVAAIKAYVGARRAFILSQITNALVPFTVTGPTIFDSASATITIRGNASIAIKDITVNGVVYPVVWAGTRTAPTAWSVQVPLAAGANSIVIAGRDAKGNVVAGTATTLTVNYTGAVASPEGAIVFSEIMYRPLVPSGEYVELFNRSATSSFDLSGWRISGLGYTFPSGSILGTNQYLVVAHDTAVFGGIYGFYPIYEFSGTLNPDGETLALIKPGATSSQDEVIDKVRYEADLPWPVGTNGVPTSGSIQLIDPAQDNSRSANWSTVYIPAVYSPGTNLPGFTNSGWRQVVNTSLVQSNGTNFLLFLSGAGDVFLDDMRLVVGSVAGEGANLLLNGDFESTLGGSWVAAGSYTNSVVSSTRVHSGSSSLHLIAGGPGSTAANLKQILPGFDTNQVCTLSFWFYSTDTNLSVTMRTSPGSQFVLTTNVQVEIMHEVYVPPQLVTRAVAGATPGAPNIGATNLPPFPSIWLNEIQPNNATGLRDAFGERDPWVELYNSGTNPVSLAGYYLANNYTSNLLQWPFATDAIVNPGEFRLVWLDGQVAQGGASEWHANFRPGPDSGQVALVRVVNSQPQVVDYLTYANIGESLSYGDFPDGQPFHRQTLYTVTPGATNSAKSQTLFINEWMASNSRTLLDPGDNSAADWIELFNAGASAVDLGGFYLTDSLANRNQFQIPAGYSIPAGGYLLVWADGKPEFNSPASADLHVSFQLSKSGEAIGLFAADGTQLDAVTFGPQTNDVSMGRCPDGGAGIVFMPAPTPRSANTCQLVNTAPVLRPIGDVIMDEMTWLKFKVIATDADLPVQALTYSLDPGAPARASINATNGYFAWLPSELQGPGIYPITVRVTDNGHPQLSATQVFTVSVREVNSMPVFVDVREKVVKAGTTLSFATAVDNDWPANTLTFTMDAGLAVGAAIDPVTGVVSWTPSAAQADHSYSVTVHAQDSGLPPLASAQTYSIRVLRSDATLLVAEVSRLGNNLVLSWESTLGRSYQVLATDNISQPSWTAAGPSVLATGARSTLSLPLTGNSHQYYRVSLTP